jgi:hypothetical protein
MVCYLKHNSLLGVALERRRFALSSALCGWAAEFAIIWSACMQIRDLLNALAWVSVVTACLAYAHRRKSALCEQIVHKQGLEQGQP